MRSEQLRDVYLSVLVNAQYVITTPKHHDRFMEMGISRQKLIEQPSFRLPGDIFFPTVLPYGNHDTLRLHSHCKPGPAKGTMELLEALRLLRRDGHAVELHTHWGGRNLRRHLDLIDSFGLRDCIKLTGYIPHWEMGDSIRSCHLGVFLENNFSIPSHAPGIPLEYWVCNRPIVTTTEVAEKPNVHRHLKEGRNSFVVESSPLDPTTIANAILSARSFLVENAEPR